MTTQPPLLAADMIRQLTHHYTTNEWITQPQQQPDGHWKTTRRIHTVTHPPLLDQIQETITGKTTNGETFRNAYGSKPAGRIDCLAYMEKLDKHSRELATRHGIPPQPLKPRLIALSGFIGHKPDKRVQTWWAQARVLNQHEAPPYSPNAPCPQETCERRGTIRVRIDAHLATCVECGHIWTDENGAFGILARWCEWASEHLAGPRHWITDPHYPPGYKVVCPECEQEREAMAQRNRDRIQAAKAAPSNPRIRNVA